MWDYGSGSPPDPGGEHVHSQGNVLKFDFMLSHICHLPFSLTDVTSGIYPEAGVAATKWNEL